MAGLEKQSSGGKVSGESTSLPKQNTRSNLNEKSPRKDGNRFGYGGNKGGTAENGFTKEEF